MPSLSKHQANIVACRKHRGLDAERGNHDTGGASAAVALILLGACGKAQCFTSGDRGELNMSSNPSPLRNGIRDITMAEWWRDPLIVVSALEKKLAELPVNRDTHRELDDQICVALRLLRAIASRTYGRISMLAVIDLLAAVDYFLVLGDENPDTGIHGYDDDAERLAAVFRNHREELDRFRLWFNQSLSP